MSTKLEALTQRLNADPALSDALSEYLLEHAAERDALRTALQEALTALAYYGPMPSHAGPCTPESGCDQECADAARFAEDMQRWKRIARGEG